MAGHVVSAYLKENTGWEIVSWGRNEFEITEDRSWEDKIRQENANSEIDYIINCIGILRGAKNSEIETVRVNSLFPHELVALVAGTKTKVIHISTDCWKDLDVYGRSKRAGEISYNNHVTMRTSIIGPELKENGSGLFHWFMTSHSLCSKY